MEYINFSSCTRSQWAWAEDPVRPTVFFQSTFWAT